MTSSKGIPLDAIIPMDHPGESVQEAYARYALANLPQRDTGEARRIGKISELAMGYGGTQESELKTKADILNEALETVKGRGLNYGKPEDNFNRIARLWNAHIRNRYSSDQTQEPPRFPVIQLDDEDVSMMMILLKVARLENSPGHHDSWVDVAGYAACGGEIASGRSDERD